LQNRETGKEADMTPTSISHSVDYPSELADAVARQAESDADAVIEFLQSVGLFPGTPIPRSFLLALGAVLRLKKWEDQGIFIHFEAGLPDSTKLWLDLLTLVF
jgi:hypothetical protein